MEQWKEHGARRSRIPGQQAEPASSHGGEGLPAPLNFTEPVSQFHSSRGVAVIYIRDAPTSQNIESHRLKDATLLDASLRGRCC